MKANGGPSPVEASQVKNSHQWFLLTNTQTNWAWDTGYYAGSFGGF